MTDHPLETLRAALAHAYRIERELGVGGMATVYLAHDLKHDRLVAIKVLNPELAAAIGAERFLSEIKLTANLQHPNLLPLFDSGDADGLLYYVMPYIEGETLRALLQREPQLPLDEVSRLVTLIAAALDFAHARGVVHRDLKPENVLLQAGQPIIADFGIALALSHAGGARVTQTGMSLGTPNYMSPEQAAGDRMVDARTDQYALGALAYEMLTGEPPHAGATAQVVIARLMTETPRSIRTARPAVSAAVDAVVLRALSKSPADRFVSCGEFARVLSNAATAANNGATNASSRFGLIAVGVIATALTVLGSVVWLTARMNPPKLQTKPVGTIAAAPTGPSIAVLPFADLSADHANAYLGDGIAETLINALVNVPGLTVAARASAFTMRDKSDNLRDVGKQLGVATVLEGSVQRAGKQLRITARLSRSADGVNLWSQNFDRSADDIFAVQDEVARAVVQALQVRMASADSSGAANGSVGSTVGGTRSTAAYDAYMKGRFLWNKRTAADLARSAEQFIAAIAVDSSYAQAWSALAESYVLFGPAEYNVPGINQDSMLTLAERAARRAIAIEPRLGQAYSALGEILEYRNKWTEAGDAFRRGVALSPRYATAHQWYAYNLMAFNRWDDAIRELETAKAIDPLSVVILYSLAAAYDGANRSAEANPLIEQALRLAPDAPYLLQAAFAHEMVQGNVDVAVGIYRRLLLALRVDASKASGIERTLRNTAKRNDAVQQITQSGSLLSDVALIRGTRGDDATIAFVNSFVGTPKQVNLNKDLLFAFLGPQLRVNPKMRAVLRTMGYPPLAGEPATP